MSAPGRIIGHSALRDEMMAVANGEIAAPPDAAAESFDSAEALADRDGLRMKNPPHPGSFIRGEIIEGHHLSVGQAAEALGVARPTLSLLLNGRASLTPEMALRIEKAFGLSVDMLMQMQCSFDVAQVRDRAAEIDVRPFVPKPAAPAKQGSLL